MIKLSNTDYCVDVFSVISKDFLLLNHLGSKVWFVLCNIKISNLVAESVMNPTVHDKVKLIMNHCEEHESISKPLQARCYKEILPKIDEEFCWSKHLYSYYIFFKNIKVLRQKVGDGEINLGQEFKSLVFDELLKQEVENLQKTYTPLVDLIKRFEKNYFFIADAVDSWSDLYLETINEQLSSSIALHIDKIMQPVCLAVNFLHRSYRCHKLSKTELLRVNEFLLVNLDEDGLDQLTYYKNKKGIFFKLFQKNVNRPATFWSTAEQETLGLSKLFQSPPMI